MATAVRVNTFTDNTQARADLWMQDGRTLWNFLNANVQTRDGSKHFTTPPSLDARPPANGNHLVDTAYIDTKLRLKKTFSTDLNYPAPDANVWFLQFGVLDLGATALFHGQDVPFDVTFPYQYTTGTVPLVFFTVLGDPNAETEDPTVTGNGRTNTGFHGIVHQAGAGGFFGADIDISWTAMGWRAVNWNDELDVFND